MSYFDGGWPPYVPVAQRRARAQKQIAALKKKGQRCEPVAIEGRTIARSFWGKAWCSHLESYSDYANRLPRGRSYVTHGAVIDLRIEAGKVTARVSGSEMYEVRIDVQPVSAEQWQAIVRQCTGQIDSLVELLQGRLSKSVMEMVTRPKEGLFPLSKDIKMRCSCPDGAWMCKHIAASLYGIGARLDTQPELLFTLRQIDPAELLPATDPLAALASSSTALEGEDLSALFGIDLAETASASAPAPAPAAKKPKARPALPPSQESASPASRTKNAKRFGKKAKAAAARLLSAKELIARGIPRHTIQSWLRSGVLLTTQQRGVYGTTVQTEARIAAYLLPSTQPAPRRVR